MAFKINAQVNKWKGNEVKLLGKKFRSNSILKAGIAIQLQAVLLCPVDFGRLRGSIFVKSKDKSIGNKYSGKIEKSDEIQAPTDEKIVYIGTAVRYAEYQEFGTNKNPAQPFLRPSFDIISGKTLTIIKSEGKSVFKEYL